MVEDKEEKVIMLTDEQQKRVGLLNFLYPTSRQLLDHVTEGMSKEDSDDIKKAYISSLISFLFPEPQEVGDGPEETSNSGDGSVKETSTV